MQVQFFLRHSVFKSYKRAQLSYTTQHRTVLIIPLLTSRQSSELLEGRGVSCIMTSQSWGRNITCAQVGGWDAYEVTALWNSTSCWCVAVTAPPDVWVGRPPRLASSHWHTHWNTRAHTIETCWPCSHCEVVARQQPVVCTFCTLFKWHKQLQCCLTVL